MIRVLVTGATGFVGRHALVPLLGLGADVHVASRAPAAGPPEIHWHQTDLLDADARAEVMARVRPTHLLHFAWYAEHGKFWESDENDTWLGATLDLARQFAKCGGRRMVGAGTCAEYDWTDLASPCREDETPIAPSTGYGRAKARCADELMGNPDLDVAWGRIFFGFGPHEDARRLVPSVIRALLRGEIAAIGPGTGIRDFAPISTIAHGFVDLLISDLVGPVNVASGRAVTIADLARRIGERMGAPERVRIGALPARPGEPEMIVADMARFHGAVGAGLSFDLDDEIDQAVGWWRSHEAAKVMV